MSEKWERRKERIGRLLQEELSELLRREMRDPRISGLISITKIVPTPDLRHAKVYVSIMGDEEKRKEVLKTLRGASGFLRHELGRKVVLKRIPELHFVEDDSLDRAERLLSLLDRIAAEERERWEEEPSDSSTSENPAE